MVRSQAVGGAAERTKACGGVVSAFEPALCGSCVHYSWERLGAVEGRTGALSLSTVGAILGAHSMPGAPPVLTATNVPGGAR